MKFFLTILKFILIFGIRYLYNLSLYELDLNHCFYSYNNYYVGLYFVCLILSEKKFSITT